MKKGFIVKESTLRKCIGVSVALFGAALLVAGLREVGGR